ncbi:MAG: high potential iron sulfur protein [Methylocystis sp.]|nr:high potential iron sulfur protein [Methylocystis sp.]MBI3274857.1 high potential iron sulfur protein [Methylocystis sp.]
MTDARPIQSNEVSRRSLLAFAAGAAAALSVSVTAKRAVGAPAKMAQQAVAYQNTPKNDQRCDACAHFVPPSSCHLVEGEISPSGWCKMFTKKT